MRNQRAWWSRREFVGTLAMVGTGGALGGFPGRATGEPAPETQRVRLINRPVLCEAPQYVAEELLQAEGFTDVRYVKKELGASEAALSAGEADITMLFGPPSILRIDAGEPIVVLAGVHVGCAEVFAGEQVRAIRDLKGKTVAIPAFRDGIMPSWSASSRTSGSVPRRTSTGPSILSATGRDC